MERQLLVGGVRDVAGVAELVAGGYQRQPASYIEFERALREGRVAEVLVGDQTITGRLKSPDARGKAVIVANRVEPALAERLAPYGVPYTRVVESTWLRDVLSWVLPSLVFFAVWFFLFRKFAEKQGMGGFISIGKSPR